MGSQARPAQLVPHDVADNHALVPRRAWGRSFVPKAVEQVVDLARPQRGVQERAQQQDRRQRRPWLASLQNTAGAPPG